MGTLLCPRFGCMGAHVLQVLAVCADVCLVRPHTQEGGFSMRRPPHAWSIESSDEEKDSRGVTYSTIRGAARLTSSANFAP